MSDQNFDKLIDHPKAQEIIAKLIQGIKPKDVADWLRLEYPNKDQIHLRLGANYLKDFLDQNLDLYATLKKDIATVKSADADKKISASLRNNRTYQQVLTDMAGKEFDVKAMLQKMGILLETRLEQFWDKMQQNPENLKADYGLIKYFEIFLNYTEKFNKIVNESPDQIIQHNVTVQVMDQYVAVMQETIRETLAEIDPDAAFLFMEKFNEKLPNIQLPETLQPKKQISTQERFAETQLLSSNFEAIEVTK